MKTHLWQLRYVPFLTYKILGFLLRLSIEGRVHFGRGKSQGMGICPNCGEEIIWLGFVTLSTGPRRSIPALQHSESIQWCCEGQVYS